MWRILEGCCYNNVDGGNDKYIPLLQLYQTLKKFKRSGHNENIQNHAERYQVMSIRL